MRELEGYPGLVVHGPLQATMLIHYAEKLRGKRLASFKFRSLATIFDNGDFTLNAIEEEGAIEQTFDAGVSIFASQAQLSGVLVRNIAPRAADQLFGIGIDV